MRLRIVLPFAVLVASIAPANAQPSRGPDPEATVVADLIVVAPTRGPAWWKATKGDSVVWIFGLPASMTPKGLKWDNTTFNRRLRGSKFLLTQTIEPSGFPPGSLDLPVLPARSARRAEAAGGLLSYPMREDEYATLPYVMELGPAYFRYHQLTQDTQIEVETAARRARVPVVKAPMHVNHWKPEEVMPQDPEIAACLDAVLEDVRVDPKAYADAAAHWANGDVAATLRTSPRRIGWICGKLWPTQWERAVAFQADTIAQALEAPGKAVAAIPVPQLVAENGVLQRLRTRGYTISDPASALTE